jgi:hypothetical protein
MIFKTYFLNVLVFYLILISLHDLNVGFALNNAFNLNKIKTRNSVVIKFNSFTSGPHLHCKTTFFFPKTLLYYRFRQTHKVDNRETRLVLLSIIHRGNSEFWRNEHDTQQIT